MNVRRGLIEGANCRSACWMKVSDGGPCPPTDKGKVMPGSTDVGDVSWITPTVQVWTACWGIGVPGHSWGITATGAMSIGHKGMLYAAKAMALIGAKLVENPELLEKAQAEMQEVTGGKPYRTPLPEGQKPPLPTPTRA